MKRPGFLILMITSAYLLVCALGYLGIVTACDNLIGWFLTLTSAAYGISGPFLLRDNLRSDKAVKRREDQDRSFWIILPGFLGVFYGSPLEWLFIPLLAGELGVWSQIVGLIMIIIGIALLGWARLILKDLYSGRIQVLEKHNLVQKGPYYVIRHPAYAAYILMCLGISLGYSSLVGFFTVALLLVPGLIYRIRIEEKLLALEFGEDYIAYNIRTKRLIPYIW